MEPWSIDSETITPVLLRSNTPLLKFLTELLQKS